MPRCDGAQHEVKDYSVFCPKVLAGIGELPDTIADRCIPIRLERKKKSQETERFRGRDAAQITEPLRLALHHWAQDTEGPRPYVTGSWGPPAASALVARDGHAWSEEQ